MGCSGLSSSRPLHAWPGGKGRRREAARAVGKIPEERRGGVGGLFRRPGEGMKAEMRCGAARKGWEGDGVAATT